MSPYLPENAATFCLSARIVTNRASASGEREVRDPPQFTASRSRMSRAHPAAHLRQAEKESVGHPRR